MDTTQTKDRKVSGHAIVRLSVMTLTFAVAFFSGDRGSIEWADMLLFVMLYNIYLTIELKQ